MAIPQKVNVLLQITFVACSFVLEIQREIGMDETNPM